MNNIKRTTLVLSAFLLWTISQTAAQPIAITNVTVIDVEQGVAKPGMSVIVTGDRITLVGPVEEIDVPTIGTTNIDGTGKYLIPGLWDMHTHVFSTHIDSLAYRMGHSNKLMVANGVIGFREMGFAMEEALGLFREGITNGMYQPQKFIYANFALDGDPPVHKQPRVVKAIKTPDQAIATLDSIVSQTNADFIKIYSVLSPEVFEAISDYCNYHGIDFAGHFPVNTPLSSIARSGIKSLEHGYELVPAYSVHADSILLDGIFSPSEYMDMFHEDNKSSANVFFKMLRENNVWITPTLTNNKGLALFSSMDSVTIMDERQKYVDWENWEGPPPAAHSFYQERFTLIKKRIKDVHEAGVGILAGTDLGYTHPFVFDGFSLHEELHMMVEFGLTPSEALKTATLNPAIFMDATDSLGTVEEGKLADLVLLDANPLDDIANTQKIRAVVANGRYFDRQALDELLAEVEKVTNLKEASNPKPKK